MKKTAADGGTKKEAKKETKKETKKEAKKPEKPEKKPNKKALFRAKRNKERGKTGPDGGKPSSGARKAVKILLIVVLLLSVLGGVFCAVANMLMIGTQKDKILSEPSGAFDCILVLGAGVREDGSMSDMLRDRMDTGIDLYLSSAAPKLLCSGDHGRKDYDEVNAMKSYAISRGVPSEDIFMDHAGFSTYESIVRAERVFGVRRAILVSQTYHLYRALYDADAFGVDAVGVSADVHTYRGQSMRDLREVVARTKDVLWCLFRPSPKYVGEAIPISGSGDVTNDRSV